jgi:hypothetical protein
MYTPIHQVPHDQCFNFTAGTEIGREIWLSLRYEKTVKLFLAGSDYDNHARYNDEQYHILPNVNEDGWLEAFRHLFYYTTYILSFLPMMTLYWLMRSTSLKFQQKLSPPIPNVVRSHVIKVEPTISYGI